MKRLFIALVLHQDIKTFLTKEITDRLKKSNARVSWVPKENLHITLKFLGDTLEDKIPSIISCISELSIKHRAVHTSIGGVSTFGRAIPKVVLVSTKGNEEYLTEIASDVDIKLHELGFDKERLKFNPHITIGRIREKQRNEKLHQMIGDLHHNKASFTIQKIALMKSTLTPQGAIYNIIEDFVLR